MSLDGPELLGDEPAAKHGYVWITRRTWDRYFFVGLVGVVAVSVTAWRFTERRGLLGFPLFYCGFWAALRWSWPQQGAHVRRLSAYPGMIPLLVWLGFWGSVGISGFAAINWAMRLPTEMEPMSRGGVALIAFAVIWFPGLLAGCASVERRFIKPKSGPRDLE